MIAVNGTYENGLIRLEKKIKSKKPLRVIVTFLDEYAKGERKKGLSINDFSFMKTREKLKKYKISLSDAVIEERRKEL